MKVIIVAGAPAVGKTSILYNTIKILKDNNNISIVKMDCLKSNDEKIYKKLGIPMVTGLSNNLCPDHFLATNFIHIFNWAQKNHSNILIIETAGLCNRCAPFIDSSLNICVVDTLSSIKSPEKLGPMVSTADIILISKSDLISQGEKEVFIYKLLAINPKAKIIEVNGITGFGRERLAKEFVAFKSVDSINNSILKHSMPCATCSYCVGEKRIGLKYHQGITSTMDLCSNS
ncbi:GTP-binding protein [Clostridium sporogenes]|uniref:GTP-binding protein n=1 Tax=Clostridium sporogenes TaxID=1509 RepID=UPI00313A8556